MQIKKHTGESAPGLRVQPDLAVPTRAIVYEYGVRLDNEHKEFVDDQIRLARALYNDIVAIMREIHREMEAVTVSHAGDEGAALQAEVDAAHEAFMAAKAGNDDDAMKAAAQRRREAQAKLWPVLKSARKAAKDDLRPLYARIGRRKECDTYQIRCAAVKAGLDFATANAVLANALMAWDKSMARGKPPRFAIGAEKTQDTLTSQFTQAGGVNAQDILSGRFGRLKLNPTDERKGVTGPGRRIYGEFALKMGAGQAAQVITGTWQYHRGIPDGAHVMAVRLIRRRVGNQMRYAMQLQMRLPERIHVPIDTERRPLVCVHFGWSMDVNGRRVAGIADGPDPGHGRLLRLPETVELDLARASQIESRRDELRDAAVPRLSEIDGDSLDDSLRDELVALRRLRVQWVAQRRLHRFTRQLMDSDLAPEWLVEWRRADNLLRQQAAHIARRARGRRKKEWEAVALDIVRQYETVAMEPLDLATAAQKIDDSTGERTEFTRKARAGRVVANISGLKHAIRWACAKTGTPLLQVFGSTARTCSICSGQAMADPEDHQTLLCTDCGAQLDRKINGAALAFQFVSPDLTELREQYMTELDLAVEAAEGKAATKRQKMAEGRKAARAQPEAFERSGDDT